MICSHPDVADKIHEELCAFEKEREKEEEANFNHSVGVSFPEDTLSNFSHRVAKFSQHLTYESLLKLQYLHAAILETLRLYPAVPLVRFVLQPPATPKFLQHQSDSLYSNMHNHGLLHCFCELGLVWFGLLCVLQWCQSWVVMVINCMWQDPKGVIADDLLPDGTKVKKGSLVVYVAYAMGRMTGLWGADACDFKPERWLKDGVVQPESPFKFTAFQDFLKSQPSTYSCYHQWVMILMHRSIR